MASGNSVDLGGGRDAVHHGGGEAAHLQPGYRDVLRRSHGEGDRVPRLALRPVGISLSAKREGLDRGLNATDLLRKFLCRDPLTRISIDEILVRSVRSFDGCRTIPG